MSDLAEIMEAFICRKSKMDGMDRLDIVKPGSYESEFLVLREMTASFKTNGTYSTSEGEKPLNVVKNRYKDIMPYDHSRVILQVPSDSKRTDYINASHIEGAVIGQTYIAAQGPLEKTVTDFWEMIWQNNVKVVVMACNEFESGKLRCKRYWPLDTKEELMIGDIAITLVEQIEPSFKEYTIRHMRARRCDQQRDIVQLHYTAWPDRGVPKCTESLWDMIETLRRYQPLNASCSQQEDTYGLVGGGTPPVVVHCSAGCGRTGTILVLDYVNALLKYGKLSKEFSLFEVISEMRRQRMAIVQSQEQYVFVHEAVADLFSRQLALIEGSLYENITRNSADGINPANEADYSVPSNIPLAQNKATSLPRLPSKAKTSQTGIRAESGTVPSKRPSVKSRGNNGRVPAEPFVDDLVELSDEYRAPPQSSPGPYKEPYDSRLAECVDTAAAAAAARKPLKVQNIWSDPVTDMEPVPMDGYSEVKRGVHKHPAAAGGGDLEQSGQKSSVRSSSTSGYSADDKSMTDSGYYSYANPDAENKWSLQGVARRGFVPSDVGPDGSSGDCGYASINLDACRPQPANRIPEVRHSTEEEVVSALPAERRPFNSTSDEGKFSGMMNKITKGLFGAISNRSQEPTLQTVHQYQQQPAAGTRQQSQQPTAAGRQQLQQPVPAVRQQPAINSSNHITSSYVPEKVVYRGVVISYPNRVGKPVGKRRLGEPAGHM